MVLSVIFCSFHSESRKRKGRWRKDRQWTPFLGQVELTWLLCFTQLCLIWNHACMAVLQVYINILLALKLLDIVYFKISQIYFVLFFVFWYHTLFCTLKTPTTSLKSWNNLWRLLWIAPFALGIQIKLCKQPSYFCMVCYFGIYQKCTLSDLCLCFY